MLINHQIQKCEWNLVTIVADTIHSANVTRRRRLDTRQFGRAVWSGYNSVIEATRWRSQAMLLEDQSTATHIGY